MKNVSKPLTYLFSFLLLSTLFLFSHCDKSNDDGNENADLVGTWTISSINIDFMIGEKSLTEYLIDAGYSESDAALYASLFESFIEDELGDGEIELKSDNTYVANFGDDPDTGKWSYNSSTKILTIDSDDPSEDTQEITVKSISSTTIVIEQSEVVEEDIDDDGTNEEINSTIEMTLTKS